MKRLFDILTSLIILLLFFPLYLLIFFLIWFKDGVPVIHWSKRVGRKRKIFSMPKFRTMSFNSPDVATHLLKNFEDYITPNGKFLRKSSLDELPQIWSVLLGEMSIVGPRPALHNQDKLTELREKNYILEFKPGITGWAQINGRDNVSILKKVELDKYYCSNWSIYLDIKIILLTIYKIFKKDDISH